MHFAYTDFLKFFLYTILFFLLFFGYNTVSGPYYETTFDSASILNQEVSISTTSSERRTVALKKNIPKKKATESSLTIAFNPEYVKVDNDIVNRLKEIIQSSYFGSKITPLHLVLDSERQDPRGQVVGNKLILSTTIPSDSEQMKVFVHELGHIVDIFYLKKGFFADPSDIFYALSWESFNTKKKGQKITNFVSGYALSNKYEDFAESFSWYVFHNEDFVKRAKNDTILQKKYDFFRSSVFGTDAFVDTSF